jgi:hypothetical protein
LLPGPADSKISRHLCRTQPSRTHHSPFPGGNSKETGRGGMSSFLFLINLQQPLLQYILKLKTLSLMLFLDLLSEGGSRSEEVALREAVASAAGNNRRNNKEAI